MVLPYLQLQWRVFLCTAVTMRVYLYLYPLPCCVVFFYSNATLLIRLYVRKLIILHKHVDQKGLTAMLGIKRPAGGESGESTSHKWGSPQTRHPPWLWHPEQMSPEVQNWGISDPTKRTGVLQKIKKTKCWQMARTHASMFKCKKGHHTSVGP